MTLQIYNDITNTFGFKGALGSLPGRHNSKEFLSSTKFSNITAALNKMAWLCGYSYYSEEGHNSFFYGSVVFRRIDGTMSAFLDSTISNYGINLPYDTTAETNISDVFNETSNLFEIPLNTDLRMEYKSPHVKVSGIFSDSTLYQYRPFVKSITGKLAKTINISLINCFTGDYFTNTDFTNTGDRHLRLQLFGFSPILIEEL